MACQTQTRAWPEQAAVLTAHTPLVAYPSLVLRRRSVRRCVPIVLGAVLLWIVVATPPGTARRLALVLRCAGGGTHLLRGRAVSLPRWSTTRSAEVLAATNRLVTIETAQHYPASRAR